MAIAESTTARTPKPRRSRAGKDLSGYLFIAPSLIFIVVFVVGPIVGALWFSLTDYDLMSAPKFVGAKNYLRLLDDERFTRSLTKFALLRLRDGPDGGSNVAPARRDDQPANPRNLHIPSVVLYAGRKLVCVRVASSGCGSTSQTSGLGNDMLELLGLPRLKFMRSAGTAMLSIIVMSVWKNMGLNMIIYLAGLQGVPPHLYESAEIDGAGGFAQFFRITLPLLAPTTFFVVIVYFIGALQMFVQVFIMTQSSANTSEWAGPLDSTLTVVVLVYQNAFEYLKMGYASAISFVLLLVIAAVTMVNARLLRYDVGW